MLPLSEQALHTWQPDVIIVDDMAPPALLHLLSMLLSGLLLVSVDGSTHQVEALPEMLAADIRQRLEKDELTAPLAARAVTIAENMESVIPHNDQMRSSSVRLPAGRCRIGHAVGPEAMTYAMRPLRHVAATPLIAGLSCHSSSIAPFSSPHPYSRPAVESDIEPAHDFCNTILMESESERADCTTAQAARGLCVRCPETSRICTK